MSLEFTLRDSYDDTLLSADFEHGEVRTNCGDVYMDYSIPFDSFLKFAEHIKKHRVNNGEKKVVDEGQGHSFQPQL